MLFVALSLYFCRYTCVYMEHWRTFYYDASYITEELMQVGGFSRLLADFFCQFYISPLQGIIINSLLLAVISEGMRGHLNHVVKSSRVGLLTWLPAISLLFCQTINNYLLEGTVGMLIMLVCLLLRQCISNCSIRRAYTLIATVLLYWLAGPISMLFALTLLISRFSPFAFFPFVTVGLLGGISYRLGHHADLLHLLSPEAYYATSIEVPAHIVWMPWALWLIVLAVGICVRYLSLPKWLTSSLRPLQVALVIGMAIGGSRTYISAKNEFYKQLQVSCRNEAWHDVVEQCKTRPMDNLLFVNCRNLALAETGQLGQRFREIPGASYNSLMVESVSSAYVYAMISDIYYSMGYLALSQLSAFDTNQQMRNLSPRMLQRLALTNLICGEYRVAHKYLTWLGKTRYYADWAARYEKMLYDDAAIEADPVLGPKRRCLPAESFFTGSVSKIDALVRIAQQNPEYQPTQQYLQAISQLQ